MRLQAQWLWGVRFVDGTYLHLEGDTVDEAVRSVGSTMAEVRRYMPLKYKEAEDRKAAGLARFLRTKRAEGSDD